MSVNLLNMGLTEAVEVVDTLRQYGALNRRTMHTYIMEALYGGPDVVEGSPAYESLLRNVYRELRDHRGSGGDHPGDKPIGPETAGYLRDVLADAAGERLPFSRLYWDEVPEEVVQEVRSLLGRAGMQHLGIPRSAWQLKPDRRLTMVLQEEEAHAREVLAAQEMKDKADDLPGWVAYTPPEPDFDGLFLEGPMKDYPEPEIPSPPEPTFPTLDSFARGHYYRPPL